MTKQEHDAALKELLAATPMTEDMVELVEKLRQHFDESEGAKIADEDGEYKRKYDELRKRYMDRFFAPPEEKSDVITEDKDDKKAVMPADIVKEYK